MNRGIQLVSALALGSLLVLGCGSGSQDAAPDPDPTTTGSSPAPEPEPTPVDPPRTDPEPAEPVAAGAFACIQGDVGAGATQYATLCASCHGAAGAGDGIAAAALDPAPASHADGNYMNALSNEHVYTVIRDGGTAVGKSASMAPWGSALSEQQLWDVVAFVRSLADPQYSCP